ncbi:MAG TPA: helix-hairpin-helix domain-containing protein, partial [Hyphomicrobiaceae bacterium]|nr:helix-hairpin-helix domain-containing protein [Hyphomicrobiaceae bacterium]
GASAVGAMIVAGPEGFVKNQYRKFNIRSADLAPGDDYAMMREVLTRRFKRLVLDEAEAPTGREASESSAPSAPALQGSADRTTPTGEPADGSASRIEQPQPPPIDRRGGSALAFGVLKRDRAAASLSETELAVLEGDADAGPPPDEASDEFPARPDLVLIDGGRGQLGVAQAVLDELGITGIALVGVAKGPERDAGREHFHFAARDKPLLLEPRDPVLYFVQRLRDEAHRFAIGTHRAKRGKAISANPLDEIAGIGSARKRALLEHFGSAKAVSRASPDDLVAVSGISRAMAQTIYDFFHERRE